MNEDLNSDWDALIYVLERAGIPIAEANVWRGLELISSSDARKLLHVLSFLSEDEVRILHGFLRQKSDFLNSRSLEEIQRLVDAEHTFIENI
jgi:hypothetical protein